MKHLLSKVVCAFGVIGVALACAVVAPITAKALVDAPSTELKDLVSVATSPNYMYNATDNYGNTYASAVSNSNFQHIKFEYLLDGKYSNFVGTLFVPRGESSDWNSGVIITADGQEVYSSPTMVKDSKPVDINVNVKGHNRVEIRFTKAGGGDGWYSGGCHLGIARAGFNLLKPSDMDPINVSGQNIFRMYNPYNGEHLYTTDTTEADNLLSYGWKWESTSSVPKTGSSVYRLNNPYSGEHLYTTNFNEYKTLSSRGWNGEGEKFHSSDSSGKPFYRVYNPWGSGVTAHTYTTDTNEVNTLTRGGWKSDGICWYGLW